MAELELAMPGGRAIFKIALLITAGAIALVGCGNRDRDPVPAPGSLSAGASAAPAAGSPGAPPRMGGSIDADNAQQVELESKGG